MLSLGIILAIGSMLVIAVVDTLLKKVTVAAGTYFTSTLFAGLAIIPLLFIIIAVPPTSVAPIYIALTVLGGLAYALGLILVLKSLETEQASNTWALSNIGIVPLILLGVLVLAEPISLIEILGMAVVIFGSLMITVTKDMKINRKLLPAIAGNVLFAVYFILTTYSVSQSQNAYSVIFPLAYAVALAALLAYGSATSKLLPAYRKLKRARLLPLAISLGLLGGVSQLLWLFVVVLKTVALGGAIQVLEPAIVVVLAYLMYREKLTPLQGIGIAVSLVGAFVVSLL